METIIKVKAEELDNAFVEKLKAVLLGLKNPEIIIHITDGGNDEYFKKLDASIRQYETGEVTSFTMEELSAYLTKWGLYSLHKLPLKS